MKTRDASPASTTPERLATRLAPAYRTAGGFSRVLLIAAVAVIFSGADRVVAASAGRTHYVFDLVVIVAILVVGTSTRWAPLLGSRLLALYAGWILLYTVWGLAVAPNRNYVLPAALRLVELNAVGLAAVAISIDRHSSVKQLASMIQIAAIANFALMLLEAVRPNLTETIARLTHAQMYVLERPGGLWINPNEAGIAFLFAIGLSPWATEKLKWAGRVAGVLGIVLTASRGAVFCLVVYSLVMLLAGRTKRLHVSALKLPAIATGALLVLLLSLVGLGAANGFKPAVHLAHAVQYSWSRYVNFAELKPEGNDVPRLSLVIYWSRRALAGPLQGSGIFSYQGNGTTVAGAHNIFITVWGELGPFGLLLFVAFLAIALRQLARIRLPSADFIAISGIWLIYFVQAFLWHNQFSSVIGIVAIAALLRIPNALAENREMGFAPPGRLNRRSEVRTA